ncbi:MAG: hypothetical protein ACRDDZ_08750 [Marinifilaceae bacterium]
MQRYYYDDKIWYKYETDDRIIITRVSRINSYGKYYRLDLGIINKSEDTYDIEPEKMEAEVVDGLNVRESLVTYSANKYLKKMKRQHTWAMALTATANGINDGMSGANASYGYKQNNYAYQSSVTNQTQVLREMQMSEYDKQFKE